MNKKKQSLKTKVRMRTLMDNHAMKVSLTLFLITPFMDSKKQDRETSTAFMLQVSGTSVAPQRGGARTHNRCHPRLPPP